MPVATVANVLEQLRLPPKQVSETLLKAPLQQAENQLKIWIGATAYDALVTAKDAGIFLAEIYLTVYYAWPLIGSRIRTDGVTIQEAVEPEGKSTRTYLTPAESDAMRQSFWNAARDCAGFSSGEPEGAILHDSRITTADEAAAACLL